MERDQAWAISTFSVAAALVLAAIAIPRFAWPLVVAAVLLLAVSGVLFRRDIGSRPRLIIGEPTAEIRGVTRKTSDRHSQMMSTTTTSVYISNIDVSEMAVTGIDPTPRRERGDQTLFGTYVRVSNQPRLSGRDAENVVTKLRFESSDGTVTEMHGRWSQLPQHGDPERTLEAEGITIPSNGEPKWVDVAIKYQDDDECYAFNDENRFQSRDLRYRPLGPSPIRVEVTAKGSNCRGARAVFTLTHSGKKSGLLIRAGNQ
jgi:hypothetical protein